ncbi:pyrroline-5-carboxylate reductase [Arthrobacter sp. V4I6]|uniref:pyrroline-5-carboxylate reductase n=1 Tax=unclassified Arthrobacter TaxID=235627 RepID=UPI00277D9FC0|nr:MULTISPECIES: pyrroline-5-carboxylate reductase [unclassified Arthrobacter]MDQ0822993.1 pyrroline-5-carboxylate reductase [Arthrobacter sp. V1I7]MDQ0852621.1 pyrroline-5-carboxylate reductase [Arthrobacter sp. V4I6]
MNLNEPTVLPSVAFLGAGAMGGAIIRGLLNAKVKVTGGIRATGQWSPQMQELTGVEDVTGYDAATDPAANVKAVTDAGIVVLALKPDIIPRVLKEIGGAVKPGAVIVSIAAGITIATLESLLPDYVSAIRVMPNTPALVGKGVTGISAGTRASEQDMALVEQLFITVGAVLTVPENQLHSVTSISESGPAYVFFLIEQLTEVAIDKGFTPNQAALLVNGTFRGASELLASTDRSPGELRAQVTSPNGTTAAALAILEEGGIRELFGKATDAAVFRAQELAGRQTA